MVMEWYTTFFQNCAVAIVYMCQNCTLCVQYSIIESFSPSLTPHRAASMTGVTDGTLKCALFSFGLISDLIYRENTIESQNFSVGRCYYVLYFAAMTPMMMKSRYQKMRMTLSTFRPHDRDRRKQKGTRAATGSATPANEDGG